MEELHVMKNFIRKQGLKEFVEYLDANRERLIEKANSYYI